MIPPETDAGIFTGKALPCGDTQITRNGLN